MRRAGAVASTVFGVAFAVAAGCAIFHDDYPSDECSSNLDCFQAQGEVCNPTTKRCEPRGGADAAPPVDAPSSVDASLSVDAPSLDADVGDAP